ncbi:DNA polymerase I [Flavimobilis sp. GY10621]|uniref:DNA polymerase I n=1 Tax=Flavimobilis rhizosphaerae TaxID=2775421 RepID=A0ABR9DRZ7_9MICO|nr:DNA polymerase I [Flavimobilis rhizosphaerae]MBD9699871.1 DNA polymerase I [Flavimobilis rhizosphaerae]
MGDRLSGVNDNVRPRLLLIDGHSMAFRAFFALPADKFTTSGGQHTNAVHGFVSMLANLIKNEQPTHVAVAFDAGSTTFRTERFPEYKGGRDATPEPFKGQVPLIREVLDALRITHYEREMIEADDILATWSSEAGSRGWEVLVCSGDRDSLQFVTDTVTVLYPVKGVSELARMTPDAVEAKYGVRPERYPDLAALVGESADNIPGVPKVGPKTAAKWLTQYGDLEGVLAHADEITGVAGQNLREHIDQVRLNRELNHLLTDLDLPYAPEDLEARPWDREAMHTIFDALQFRTLRDRLLAMMPAEERGDDDVVAGPSLELDAVAPGGLGAWLAARGGKHLGLEVRGRAVPGSGDADLLALGDADGHAVVVDLTEIEPADDAALGAWLADEDAPKFVHGGKARWHELQGRGYALRGVTLDTELAAYLCHPDQRTFDLEDLTIRSLHREIGAASPGGTQGSLDLDLDGDGGELTVLAERASILVPLGEALADDLADRSATKLLELLELPLADVLARMEDTGIAVDVDLLRELDAEFGEQARHAAEEAYAVIGREVNLGSPKQLQEVLFDQLDMPRTKKIKTGYTTDAAALTELFAKTQHPFLEHLLAHRDVTKLRQTVETLLRYVGPDGRIHTTFQQTVAATGRLSSADPNLQNIPIRTAAGRRIRRAFVVGDGYETLLTADYSQIEMRIMAHLSGDEGLIEAFRSGEDLHNYVASRVFGVATTDVSPAQRSKIKAMSYGLAYGLSAFGLSKQLGIEVGEAQKLMDDYFTRFGGVRTYLHEVVEAARATGYTETILGRRRYLPDLTSDNRQRREIAERVALNSPIQGSAADIIKIAMLEVRKELDARGLRSRLLLQVHDELVLEVAPGEFEEVEALLRAAMGGAAKLSVPLDVSVGTGPNWHDAGH